MIFLSAADKYYENRFYSQEWKDALPSTSLRSRHDTHAKSYEFNHRSRLELARYKAWLKVMVGQKMRHFAISIDTMCSINVNVQTLINARTKVEYQVKDIRLRIQIDYCTCSISLLFHGTRRSIGAPNKFQCILIAVQQLMY